MTLSAPQKKFLHTVIGGVSAGLAYAGINALPLPADIKIPLLALLVSAVIRAAGAVLAVIETQPPGPPA